MKKLFITGGAGFIGYNCADFFLKKGFKIKIYDNISREKIPDTESLKDTYERVIPYFKNNILPKIKNNVIISAHGNSLRSICKFLFKLDNKKISKLEIPTGNPLLIKFKNSVVESANYLDKERAKDLLVF